MSPGYAALSSYPGTWRDSRCAKLAVYLCARGVACAGPCGGSLRRTVRALSRQPSAAVRVAEALAVLFADLRRQTAKCLNTMLTLHMTWARTRMRQCLFFISASVNSAEGLALTAQKPSAFHLEREKPYAVQRQSDNLPFSGEGSGK